MHQNMPWARLIMGQDTQDLYDDVITIGRCEQARIKLHYNEQISLEHCRIAKEHLVLTDLSTNGTYVNDRLVGKGCKVVLQSGDQIQILHPSKVGANASISFKFESFEQSKKAKQRDQQFDQLVPQQQQKGNAQDEEDQSIKEAVTCPICQLIIYQPVTIFPCGHSFCGGCLVVWQNKDEGKICPMDRREIIEVTKSIMIKTIVENYLSANPTERRNESDRKQLEALNTYYKNPQQQFIPKKNMLQIPPQIAPQILQQFEVQNEEEEDSLSSGLEIDHPSDDEIDELIHRRDEDEDDDDDDDYYHRRPILNEHELINPYDLLRLPQQQLQQRLIYNHHGIQLGMGPQQRQPIRKDCKSCLQPWKGYRCEGDQVHVPCGSCNRPMPKRILDEDQNAELKLFCQICKEHHCKYYYGDCGGINTKLILLREIGRHVVNFHQAINKTEQQRIQEHLINTGKTMQNIFQFIVEEYVARGLFYFVQDRTTQNNPMITFSHKLLPETPICWLCIAKVAFQMTLRYVQVHKLDDLLFSSEDCRYGINCRWQNRDVHHAHEYNHMCEQTVFD